MSKRKQQQKPWNEKTWVALIVLVVAVAATIGYQQNRDVTTVTPLRKAQKAPAAAVTSKNDKHTVADDSAIFADSPFSWMPNECVANAELTDIEKWGQKHGLKTRNVANAEFHNRFYGEMGLRGVKATAAIKKGEVVSDIPQALWMTSKKAKEASDFGKLLQASADAGDINAFMHAMVRHEKP